MNDTATRVSAHLECTVTEPAEIVLSIATAIEGDERLVVQVDGADVPVQPVTSVHGTRLHVLQAPVGALVVDYASTLTDADAASAPEPEQPDPAEVASDRILYLRPSRYAESDTLAPVAAAQFAGLQGKALLDAVSSWVGAHLAYVSGSSRPTDGAVQTYLARAGVCRDFAHLVVELLRALDVPARLASVYAPGLTPMDFHAVAEAMLDDRWVTVDATTLAPRSALVRIATGRDASDTAFMTVQSGRCQLDRMAVTAVREPDLPEDDLTQLVGLPGARATGRERS